MPEGLEAEIYRRALVPAIGRRIVSVEVDERQDDANPIAHVVPGSTIDGARRIGKLVLVDTDAHTLGLHFGMTGRLVVGDRAAIEQLEYASNRDDPAWDRFTMVLDDDTVVRINDPRRWGRFSLDPDEARLGPDFLTVTGELLGTRLARRRAPLKAVLLDQATVAGFGNLCIDEVLWQAGLAPDRPANSLTESELRVLVDTMRHHLPRMLERGGSHTGVISPELRAAMLPCPRDGGSMRRDQIGGRTTVWCPVHQLNRNPESG